MFPYEIIGIYTRHVDALSDDWEPEQIWSISVEDTYCCIGPSREQGNYYITTKERHDDQSYYKTC